MQSEKMCVVLLFGGMSSEHEVSRVSVGNFVNNIDREKYETLAVASPRRAVGCTPRPRPPRWPMAAGKIWQATWPESSVRTAPTTA